MPNSDYVKKQGSPHYDVTHYDLDDGWLDVALG